MSVPFLRSRGQFAASFSSTLNLPLGSAVENDCVIVHLEGVDWFGNNAGGPSIPAFLKVLDVDGPRDSGFRFIAYGRVPAGGLGSQITFVAGPGMTTSGGWWGIADVIGGCAWKMPGWLEFPGTPGDYATFSRADVANTFTTFGFQVKVSVDALGVTQWLGGWANGDAGIGLDSSNRPVVFVNNTLGNPIGNVAANADIPDLAVGETVWIRADITIATGECNYYYSIDPGNRWSSVFWHWQALGTAVAGTNGGTTPRVTNSDTVFIGTRDAATTGFAGKIYSFFETRNFFPSPNLVFSDDLPGAVALIGGDVDHLRPTAEDLVNGVPFEFWRNCWAFCYLNPPEIYIPGMDVYGADRLAFHVWRGGKFFSDGVGHTTGPLAGPANWEAHPDRAGQVLGFYLKDVTRTREVDATFGDEDATNDGAYSWSYHQFVFVGLTDPPVQPDFPQPPVVRLGCAESYGLFITDDTYERVIEQVRFSEMHWGRVLDDVSQADALLPDELGGLNCVAHLGGLVPWKFGMAIERNDALVWRGPVTKVQRAAGGLRMSAADVLIRYRKRFLLRNTVPTADFDGDAAVLFRDVITTHAAQPSDSWSLPVPEVISGVTVRRALKPREFKYAFDLLGELLDHAIDAFMMNGVLYVWQPNAGWRYQAEITRTLEGPYNVKWDLVYGTFTEEAWSEKPGWTMDGMEAANFVVVPAADSGQEGFRQYQYAESTESQGEFGVLDHLETDAIELPEDATPAEVNAANLARARSTTALRAFPPLTLEGGALSEDAPIDMDHLRPGSLWRLDVYDAGFGQLLTVGRLRRVDVTVRVASSGTIEETVAPVLEPPGQEGAL